MRTFDNLSPEAEAVLIRILSSTEFQMFIGEGDFPLTEAEEQTLWDLLSALPKEE